MLLLLLQAVGLIVLSDANITINQGQFGANLKVSFYIMHCL